MKMKHYSHLVFLETPEFLELMQKADFFFEALIIAENPEMVLECERAGITFSTPEDFFDPFEFYSLSESWDNNTKSFCLKGDQAVFEIDKRFQNRDVYPFKDSLYLWKIILDSIRIKIHKLKKIASEVGPITFHIQQNPIWSSPKGKKTKKTLSDLLLEDFDNIRLYQQLITKLSDLKVRFYECSSSISVSDSNRNFFLRKFASILYHPPLKSLIKGLFFWGFNLYQNRKNKDKKVKILVEQWVLKKFPAIATTLINTSQFQIDTINFREQFVNRHVHYRWKNEVLRHISEFSFSYMGVSYFSVVEPFLTTFISNLEHFLNSAKNLKNIVRKKKPDFFLTMTFSSLFSEMLPFFSRAIKQNNANSGCIVHGGTYYGLVPPGSKFNIFPFSDILFSYGEGTRFLKDDGHFEGIVAPIGNPLRLRVENKNINISKKKIIFLTGTFRRNFGYVGWNSIEYGGCLNTQTWNTTCRIIDVLGAFQNEYNVIVKPPSGRNGLGELYKRYTESRGFDKVSVMDSIGFLELAHETDLIVVNYLDGSCPVFESIDLPVDIFIYKNHTLTSEAEQILTESFYYLSGEDFFDNLHRYLVKGSFCQKDKSKFNKRYCQSNLKGTPGENIITILFEAFGIKSNQQ